jgi:hypothetical protein
MEKAANYTNFLMKVHELVSFMILRVSSIIRFKIIDVQGCISVFENFLLSIKESRSSVGTVYLAQMREHMTKPKVYIGMQSRHQGIASGTIRDMQPTLPM